MRSVGGSCAACNARDYGPDLGDRLTRQFEMIRGVNPQARCRGPICWTPTTMPTATTPSTATIQAGTTSPKVGDRLLVLSHVRAWRFSGLGFKTLAGAYYDGDTLENPKGWLESLARTPGAVGIMYTSWQNKYGLLGPFGDLTSGR